MWGEADPAEIKALWAAELGLFDPDDLKWALNALRTAYLEFPPTLFQFVALCRDGRKVREQRGVKLAPPGRNSADAEAAASIVALAYDFIERKQDPLEWARKIIRRHEAGEVLPPLSIQSAVEALQERRSAGSPMVDVAAREANAERRALQSEGH